MIWKLIYNSVVIPLGWLAFRLTGVLDRKARRGVVGREDLFERLRQEALRLSPSARRVWFHSSSMGEFEQAKPIIAALKRRHPDTEVIVTFFSPSGYEHSRAYKLAAIITYIPFDSRSNAERFVSMIQPTAAVIVRYDVWPNHVWALEQAGIPIFIANATLHRNTARAFPLARQFHTFLYDAMDHILTVSASDAEVFQSFHLQHAHVEAIGDTRYDQVWQRSEESRRRSLIPTGILSGRKVLVAGSSWQEDEDVLISVCDRLLQSHPDLLLIVVPHEPTLENLESIERRLNSRIRNIRFSNLQGYEREEVIIVDSVGILMALYQYAHVAYVGGGFGRGVHNVLEPSAFGIPVVVGPKHQNSQEAVQLIEEGGAFSCTGERDLFEVLDRLLSDDCSRETAGKVAHRMVQRNIGATERFLSYLEKVL